MGDWNFGWYLKSNLAPLLESCGQKDFWNILRGWHDGMTDYNERTPCNLVSQESRRRRRGKNNQSWRGNGVAAVLVGFFAECECAHDGCIETVIYQRRFHLSFECGKSRGVQGSTD